MSLKFLSFSFISKLMIFSVINLSLIFSSCNQNNLPKEVKTSLSLAGENKKELLKVIEKYNKDPKDSLKLKSALYLIANMPYHSFSKGNSIFDEAFVLAGKEREKKIKENPREKNPKSFTNRKLGFFLDSISEENNLTDKSPVLHYDLRYINAEFLIDNIELAFKAHEKMPLKLCKDFDEFLHYVLPYRVGREPIEVNKRKELFEEYSWVYDSVKKNSLDEVVEQIYEMNRFKVVSKRHPNYNYSYSLTQMDHIKIGSCIDITVYIVSILRALGIPSGYDYTTKLTNKNKITGAHTWIFYLNNGFQRVLNSGPVYFDLKKTFQLSYIPKMYRNQYHQKQNPPFDVTHLYRDVFDVTIPAIWNKDKLNSKTNVFLGVHNKHLFKFTKADRIVNGTTTFNNMGNNIIYFPYIKNPRIPINYPFELTKDGEIKYFNDTITLLEKAKLLRKYPPFRIRSKKQKYRRVEDLNGAIIQASNIDADEHYITLDTISNFKTTHSINFYFKRPKTYKYFRFKALRYGRKVSVASFKLLDDKNGTDTQDWDKLLINGEEKPTDYKKIIDDNQLSYIERKFLTITYTFKESKEIYGFEIQARNDGNHINIGDRYELHYWNKKWISLGEQTAKDTVLYYNSIPKNMLYLLKNNSRGKEESVFKFDDDGNQFWVGCTEYENDKSIYSLK
jgi:hypothetical protein